MDIRKLQNIIIDALEDLKGQHISAFNTVGLTDLFDRVYVVTGTSNRHTRSLAASVRDKVKTSGGMVISVEGEDTGEWVLVDLGDAVVHIMQPTIRAYYNLEELWGAKPVPLRAGGVADPAPAKKAAKKTAKPRKTAAKKAPARKPAVKRAAPRSKPKSSAKRPAKKRAS